MHPCTTNSDKRVKTALLESHYKINDDKTVGLSVPKTKEELSQWNKAWLPSNVGEVLVPRKKEGGEGGQK